MKICENCNNINDGFYSDRFCSEKCSRAFSTKNDNSKELKDAICIDCKSDIKINKRASLKTCRCKKCKILLRKKQYKENNNRVCKYCGKEIKYKFKQICDICSNFYKNIYRDKCSFKFNLNKYKDEFDLSLYEKHGTYTAKNRGDNFGGIVRDHMFSVYDAYKISLDPILVSHPANCKLMVNIHNLNKNRKSSITLQDLIVRILQFESKYKTENNKIILEIINKIKN